MAVYFKINFAKKRVTISRGRAIYVGKYWAVVYVGGVLRKFRLKKRSNLIGAELRAKINEDSIRGGGAG